MMINYSFTIGAFALVNVPQVVRLIPNVMEKVTQIWVTHFLGVYPLN